jgi:DNA-binding beta-propeller fold protein YncE
VVIGFRPDPSGTQGAVGELLVSAGEAPVAMAAPGTAPELSPTTVATPVITAPPTAGSRQLEIQVYPSDADAVMEIHDITGSQAVDGATFTGELEGVVTVDVTAEGFRAESHTIGADVGGRREVFLDPSDQAVDRLVAFVTGSAPKQVAFTPDGSELWVTLLAGSGLEIHSPTTGELLAEIDLPEAGSVEIIFDHAGETAWVSQMETARVYEIDVASRQIRRTLETGGSWTKVMALSVDETRLWASNWVSNDISEFDLATGEMVRRIPSVATPRGLAAVGDSLYVAGYDGGDIEAIDLATGEGTVLEHTGGAMRHLVADPAGDVVYASDMARDAIFVIDARTGTVSHLATTDRLPNTIDLTPDGRLLAVSNRGRNNPDTYYLPGPQWGSVLLIDTASGEVLDAIVGGNQPTGLDISSDGRMLAYSDFLDNRVTVVEVPPFDDLAAAGGGRADTYKTELEK